jgi:hypothetical protein
MLHFIFDKIGIQIKDPSRAIAKFKQQKKDRSEDNPGPGKKSLVFLFLFEEINALKRQLKPEKTASNKKITRKDESVLSTGIKLTTSSDEGENQEYFFTSSKPFSSSKNKLAKSSYPQSITELLVSLIANHEEPLLKSLADTGINSSNSSSSILEANTSDLFIKTDDSNTNLITWGTMGGKFTTNKAGI